MKSLFLTSLQEFMLARQYARTTIKAYLYWTVQYPSKLGKRGAERLGDKKQLSRHHHLSQKQAARRD